MGCCMFRERFQGDDARTQCVKRTGKRDGDVKEPDLMRRLVVSWSQLKTPRRAGREGLYDTARTRSLLSLPSRFRFITSSPVPSTSVVLRNSSRVSSLQGLTAAGTGGDKWCVVSRGGVVTIGDQERRAKSPKPHRLRYHRYNPGGFLRQSFMNHTLIPGFLRPVLVYLFGE